MLRWVTEVEKQRETAKTKIERLDVMSGGHTGGMVQNAQGGVRAPVN